ncbi:MAG: GntR family transcriptional regulator [Eubacterium sp.]|nr:GntR family transcriptional regulator [Eubacterium sp.]
MLHLNYRDAKPIYEQIKEGIRHLLLTNAIAADEKLPSVRELASNLAINPNTIQRAYKELETEGYVYSMKGKGTFASATDFIHKSREQELLMTFDDVVTELFVLEVSKEELGSRLENLKQGRLEKNG